MQEIRGEVIKNYVPLVEDYGPARKMVNVRAHRWECHEHLTFLFMAEFVSSLRGKRASTAIAAYEKPGGCKSRN